MHSLFRSLIENCEIGIRKDSNGWNISAKGPFALVVVLVIVLLFKCFR